MSHVLPINQINRPLLARAHHQMLMRPTANFIRQNNDSAGSKVEIRVIQKKLIKGCEVIGQLHPIGGGKFEHAVAIIIVRYPIKRAVAGGNIDIVAGVAGGTATVFPNSAQLAIRRRDKSIRKNKGLCIVCKQPAASAQATMRRKTKI